MTYAAVIRDFLGWGRGGGEDMYTRWRGYSCKYIQYIAQGPYKKEDTYVRRVAASKCLLLCLRAPRCTILAVDDDDDKKHAQLGKNMDKIRGQIEGTVVECFVSLPTLEPPLPKMHQHAANSAPRTVQGSFPAEWIFDIPR